MTVERFGDVSHTQNLPDAPTRVAVPGMAIRQNVGQELRRWRKKKNLTQTQLARLAGIHLNTVHKYESTQSEIQLTTLTQICAALGIRPERILRASAD